jgi:putative molybdopterin biosynthesis protein
VVGIMTHSTNVNRVRPRRIAVGLTQAELASRAGVSRTAVTAIEAGKMAPSVVAALGLAKALETTVEALFGGVEEASALTPVWGVSPLHPEVPRWSSEIAGRTVLYPAEAAPMWTPLPVRHGAESARETLFVATCDPAAGYLASLYAEMTGYRMLVIPRSSRMALELLKQRVVHVAGLHLEGDESPGGNVAAVQEMLGGGYRLIRGAVWTEGIALAIGETARTVAGVTRGRLTWVGREPGSGARRCQDRLLGQRPAPPQMAQNHRALAEAIRSGWAQAGVCVELACREAGLPFLPVQSEAYDLCYPEEFRSDPRLLGLVKVLRSTGCRRLLGDLPGYDTSNTGDEQVVPAVAEVGTDP